MIAAPGKVLVTNLDLPVAGDIYFFDVPENTCHFTAIARNKSIIKLSYDDQHEYITVPAGCGYYDTNLKYNGAISFISSAPNETVEIVCWYGQP